jgi:hypothetical protein
MPIEATMAAESAATGSPSIRRFQTLLEGKIEQADSGGGGEGLGVGAGVEVGLGVGLGVGADVGEEVRLGVGAGVRFTIGVGPGFNGVFELAAGARFGDGDAVGSNEPSAGEPLAGVAPRSATTPEDAIGDPGPVESPGGPLAAGVEPPGWSVTTMRTTSSPGRTATAGRERFEAMSAG